MSEKNVFTKDDLFLLLNHPHIKTTSVLGGLIGESMHNIANWKKHGISKPALAKINSCEHLTKLDMSIKECDKVDVDVEAVCKEFIEWFVTTDMSNMVKVESKALWKHRGKISAQGAVLVNALFSIPFDQMRPDKPKLFWPSAIKKYKTVSADNVAASC